MGADPKRQIRHHQRDWLPYAVLVAGVALTTVASVFIGQSINDRSQRRFESSVRGAEETIRTRLESYLALLRGGAALVMVKPGSTRDQWRDYVERLRVPEFYPGIRGIGYSVRLRGDETETVVSQLKNQGLADFRIWPTNSRAEYHAIIFLEPSDKRNLAALGYDMYTEATRRAAMDTAWTNGTAAISGKVRLVQEIEGPAQAGFLIYVPVFRDGIVPLTIAERREALVGFVYAPFRADDLLRDIFREGDPRRLNMEVFDGPDALPNHLLHRSTAPGEKPSRRPRHRHRMILGLPTREWSLAFSSPAEFEAAASQGPAILVAVAGVLTSLLLFYFTNAERLARRKSELSAAELLASEESYRTICETVADGILTIDENSVIVSTNRAAEEIFGYGTAEMIGQSLTMLMPEGLCTQHWDGLQRFLAAGEPRVPWNGLELPGLRKDGREIPLEISFGMSSKSGRKIFIGTVRDVTQRKQAGQAFRFLAHAAEVLGRSLDSETVLSNLAQLAVPQLAEWCAVFIVQPDGAIHLLRVAHDEPDKRAALEELLARYPVDPKSKYGSALAIQSGQPVLYEHLSDVVPDLTQDPTHLKLLRRIGIKSALMIPLKVRGRVVSAFSLLTGTNGRTLGQSDLNLGEELAKRASLAVENALLYREARESEERFRVMADNAPVLIWISDSDRSYTWFNRRWLEFAGRTMKQALGDGWTESVHDEDLRRCLDVYARSFEAHQPFRVEYRLRRHDGVWRWILDNGIPRYGHDRGFLGYIGSCIDITERKEAEQHLHEAQDKLARHASDLEQEVAERTAKLTEIVGELEAFSYSVSHDLRAPLRAMQGYSQAFLEDFGEQLGTTERSYLDKIIRASQRLDTLVQDVLAYSRVARSEIQIESIDPEKLIHEIIEQYPVLQPPSAGITIQGSLPRVLGHDASLTQCLSNLLDNAVKFVAPGVLPRVQVRAETVDQHVRLWIEDNGIGIAPRNLERIFGMFRRLHGEGEYEGTGIGLAIVKKAAQRMGGDIGVESTEGQGSKFWLELKKG